MTEPERRGGRDPVEDLSRLVPGPPPRSAGSDVLARELNDHDYAEIRAAMGLGTRTLLLGTSTRALDRNFEYIRASRDSDNPSSIRRGKRIHLPSWWWWKALLPFFWVFISFNTFVAFTMKPPANAAILQGFAQGTLAIFWFVFTGAGIWWLFRVMKSRAKKRMGSPTTEDWPRDAKDKSQTKVSTRTTKAPEDEEP